MRVRKGGSASSRPPWARWAANASNPELSLVLQRLPSGGARLTTLRTERAREAAMTGVSELEEDGAGCGGAAFEADVAPTERMMRALRREGDNHAAQLRRDCSLAGDGSCDASAESSTDEEEEDVNSDMSGCYSDDDSSDGAASSSDSYE